MKSVTNISEEHWSGIMAVQENAYTELEPEAEDVLRSKWQATPDACFVSVDEQGAVEAYLLAHHWQGSKPPALFTELDKQQGDSLHLHDMAVHSKARGKGLAGKMLKRLLSSADRLGVKKISLVSVQDSADFWEKQGFSRQQVSGMCATYGDEAVYMERRLK